MQASDIIEYIRTSEKKTPVKVYIKEIREIAFPDARVFTGSDGCKIVFGEWKDIKSVIEKNKEYIQDIVVENDRTNSAIALLDTKNIHARIEPGAIIRDKVEIGDNAVIMMGAIINIGAKIGEGTMIDMGAVLGGRAVVGKRSHIGAGAVLAGVIEPPSANPVRVGDNVIIGANAVVLEGVSIADNAVVAAGAVVINDVGENEVVAGVPAKVIKRKEDVKESKTEILDALRELNK